MNPRFEEDIVLAKVSTIRKVVATIRSRENELPGDEKEWMRLDLTVLNLQRAVEAAIDVASHLISANGWELPRDARHAFEILVTHGVISGASLKVLHAAVGSAVKPIFSSDGGAASSRNRLGHMAGDADVPENLVVSARYVVRGVRGGPREALLNEPFARFVFGP